MEDFNTALIREKVDIIDDAAASGADDEANVIRSNRIFLKLQQPAPGHKTVTEKVVIRCQNMHSTMRLAARVMTEFYDFGFFGARETPFDWDAAWADSQSDYEKAYNQQNWAAAYIDGKSVFRTRHSPFTDIIEQCAMLNIDDYDQTMRVTQGALKRVGKEVKISHATTVAAIMTDVGDQMRCGILHRTDGRDAAFNFTATGGVAAARVPQSLGTVGLLLEGLNLRHALRGLSASSRVGFARKHTEMDTQLTAVTARLVGIDRAIRDFEQNYSVKYRPEKPVFFGGKALRS